MKEQFINRYSLQKTLCFSLIPVGKTEENFNKNKLLEEDEERSQNYIKVKGYIDRLHRQHIESSLKAVKLDGVREYADLYWKSNKDDNDKKNMKSAEKKMREQTAHALEGWKSLCGEDVVKNKLEGFLTDEDERRVAESFRGFTTYFNNYFKNRENIYSSDEKVTAVSYRCINENLPKFLDNAKNFQKIRDNLSADVFEALNDDFDCIYGCNIFDFFSIDFFNLVLAQSGIEMYNSVIGGYTGSDGTKIKGLNEYINLHNQQVGKNDKALRLPFMKPLYKQILSENEKRLSFIPEKFSSDDEVLNAIKEYYNNVLLKERENSGKSLTKSLLELFSNLNSFDQSGVFIKNDKMLSTVSKSVFGDWNVIRSAWDKRYEISNPVKAKTSIESYNNKKDKSYKKAESFSLAELQSLVSDFCENENAENIAEWYTASVTQCIKNMEDSYAKASELIESGYEGKYDKKLCRNDWATKLIKDFLDSVKRLELLIKPLLGEGKEENKEELFYGEFEGLFFDLSEIDKLYDKVRNYMTQKPYSKDKIKLNFRNYQLLGGWDKSKEKDYRTVLLRRNGLYYLAVMEKGHNKVFVDAPQSNDADCYEKMEYKLLTNPFKALPKTVFSKKHQGLYSPPDRIVDIRESESYKKGATFNKDKCHEFIDFYKESIDKNEDWSQYNFEFTPTEQYNDINEFYNEVEQQGYALSFISISKSYIDELVEKGFVYLFQIYNKDFSKYSHGNPNLHTLYFKMLFDERNLSDVVYKLNGKAEMFYRKASINDKEKIVHTANVPIESKPDSKKTSVFKYDLVKDKRFTQRQFSLHLPITVNFKAPDKNDINADVRKAVKDKANNCVIGIDRGERNLIYISVVDSDGNILEQYSLNKIIGDNGYGVDYQSLLDKRESARDEERKSWSSIENIKELKMGYLSQVVHKICELVVKYDAVIAMEDLSVGFKRGRFKVEKQVYQKFENMLISKLNLLASKTAPVDSDGGLLRAYQLTNKLNGKSNSKQNGIIFYVPAWLTSKIDPATGFVNLLKLSPKRTSLKEAKELFAAMDDIRYNKDADMFEFDIDYDKIPGCNSDYKKKWTVCTNGERIESCKKDNSWCNKRVILTDEFKALFGEYGIDYTENLQEKIVNHDVAKFYSNLIRLLALTLQMRNSITGSTLAEDDFIISPVADENGVFYDSRNYKNDSSLPCDADANGAYNIARKALWAIDVLKNTDDSQLHNAKLAISNAEWLKYAQK